MLPLHLVSLNEWGFFVWCFLWGRGPHTNLYIMIFKYSEKLMHGTELWKILASLFLSMYFQHLVEYYYTIKAPDVYIRRCIHQSEAQKQLVWIQQQHKFQKDCTVQSMQSLNTLTLRGLVANVSVKGQHHFFSHCLGWRGNINFLYNWYDASSDLGNKSYSIMRFPTSELTASTPS